MCSSYSNTNMKHRKQFPLERRPKMLKDFLADDFGSCSSSGFKSLPRTVHADSCLPILTETINASNNSTYNTSYNSRSAAKLSRSRSISAFQAMINAIKNLHFSAVKSPSILPRSLSRRLSKRRLQRGNTEMIKSRIVTVKDIIRWRSFRDIVEEKQEQSPPFDYITTTTTTVSTATTPSSSNASSWCDSDFTSEYLPEEYVENEAGKKNLPCVGADLIETIQNYNDHDLKVDEEKQLLSPVSVIDFEFFEDEESISSFDQALASEESTKNRLMQKIRRFESLANQFEPFNLEKCLMDSSFEEDDDEDKETRRSCQEEEDDDQIEENVWQLLNHLKTTSQTPLSNADELLLSNFLRDELGANKEDNDNIKNRNITKFYGRILERAEGWINGESSLWVGLKEKYNKGAYLDEMDKGGLWSNFGEEKEELALAIESDVVGTLVDEILLDLISCSNLRQR